MGKRTLLILLAGIVLLATGVWIGSSNNGTPTPTVTQQTDLTVRSATPEGSELGSACKVLPLGDVRKAMKAPDMESVNPDTIYVGGTYACIYRNLGMTAVGVIAYDENADVFTSSRIQLAKLYKEHQNEKYYKRASISDMSTVNTVPDTQTFYVHSAKYGHDLMFVNNGHVTVRLRISPFDLNRALNLVGVAAIKMNSLKSVTDIDKLDG